MKPLPHPAPLKAPIFAALLQFVRRFGLYATAAGTLVLLALAGWMLARFPYAGFHYLPRDGRVTWVDPHGPAAGRIQTGDRVFLIDGKPPRTARNLPVWHAGQVVTYQMYGLVNHGRGDISVDLFKVKLTLTPPPLWLVAERFSPLAVALAFWLAGVLVLALSQPGRLTILFFCFSQMVTLTLGLSTLENFEPAWLEDLYHLVLWWVGPITVHTQMTFLRQALSLRVRRFLAGLYGAALGLTLAFLPWGLLGWESLRWAGVRIHDIWFALMLGCVILFPGLVNQWARSLEERQTAAILGVSVWTGLLPLLIFSLLPDLLLGQVIFKYEITLLALILIPGGYGYSIFRYRLVSLERTINRSAAYTLAALLIGGLYSAIYILLPQLLPGKSRRMTLLSLVITLILVFAAHPVYLLFQRWLYQLFYGDWYDDRSAVKRVSEALGQAEGDTSAIALNLCQALHRIMQMEYVHFLLYDGRLFATRAGAPWAAEAPESLDAETSARLLAGILKGSGGRIGSARDLARGLDLPARAARRLLGSRPQMWLLLTGVQTPAQPLGLLVLGPRRGGEFERRDIEILEVVVRQAKAALENAVLLEEVRQRSAKIRRLHRQVLEAREEERKRVARDLHDQIIQALVGLNYQLASERSNSSPETGAILARTQTELRTILSDLRQVCADLRPPALDTLGLAPALQSRIVEMTPQLPFQVELQVDGDEELDLPEPLALCLYRVFQEGLQNAKKHAGAQHVRVRLELSPCLARLVIEDDGCGFELPPSLGSLVQDRHFGLVGLRELLESVQGQLWINTAPGAGCCLVAEAPLVDGKGEA